MSRIHVQTLVLAFEKRIEALEKNPPDKISTAVILNLLEIAIDEVLKEHFIHLAKKDLEQDIRTIYEEQHEEIVKKCMENILKDESLTEKIEKSIKRKILKAFECD